MSLKKKEEFIIRRTDQLEESPKISLIYNLSKLKEIKELKGNKSINQEKKEIIFSTIKKLILSINLYSKWKTNTTQYLLIFIHFSFIISGLCSFVKNKEDFIKKNKKISKFILKLIILHLMLIPLWIIFYNKVSNISNKIQRIMLNLGKYILKYDSMNNKYFNFELLSDYSLKVISKDNYKIKKDECIFLYAISFNIDFFEAEDILYKSLIPNSDFAIINNIYTFMNQELNTRFEFFLNKLIIPSFISIISFYYLSKDTPYYVIKCTFVFLILLIFVILLENDYKKEYLEKFENYLKNYNQNYYIHGKYIYKYKSLLIIFTLNTIGKIFALDKIKRGIQKILKNNY